MADPYAKVRGEQLIPNEAFARLNQLVDEQEAAAEAVVAAELELKRVNERYRAVAERDLPELMAELGLTEFRTERGLRISIKETVRASIPDGRREDAMRWLDDNGHGALVKRMVSVSFNREQAEEARKLMEQISGEFPTAREERKVESATLRAFIRQELEAGHDIPLELFGAFVQKTAEVKRPK